MNVKDKIAAVRKDPSWTNWVRVGGHEAEHHYLALLDRVLRHGDHRPSRPGTDTLAVFGPQLVFDLQDGFPLITTKKVWWKGIAVELDWMLQGLTNIAYLREHGVGIWDEWADEHGELGPVYGKQWRKWTSLIPDNHNQMWNPVQVDQVAEIVDKLRNNRHDRRIILSAWNVAEIHQMRLPPCHYASQYLVDSAGRLTCIVSLRSWDLFLGGPFNIGQYALLTHLFARVSGLVAHRLIMNAADAHIYVNHIDAVVEQLCRQPRSLPSLVLDPELREIDDFRFHHATIEGYDPHPAIKGDVAV